MSKPCPLFPIGAKVMLRGCHYGQPGTVLRIERRKVAVYWADLDYLARHSPASLTLARQGLIKPMGLSNRHE